METAAVRRVARVGGAGVPIVAIERRPGETARGRCIACFVTVAGVPVVAVRRHPTAEARRSSEQDGGAEHHRYILPHYLGEYGRGPARSTAQAAQRDPRPGKDAS